MKVFILVENPYQLGNPYIATLVDGISKLTNEIEWGYGISNFWNDVIFSYDIIHVHWPDMILGGTIRSNFDNELEEITPEIIFLSKNLSKLKKEKLKKQLI